MKLKELREKFKSLFENNPDLLLALQALRPELDRIVHPGAAPSDDIEERLDSDYEQILADNKKSESLKALEKVLVNLLRVAAAKNGLKL